MNLTQTTKTGILNTEACLRLFARQENFADVNLSLGSRYNKQQFRPTWIKDPESK
jgi:hypothetical protein